ncbi:hypothetical protein [Streptomyces sp. NBC_01237]|uniref:hypothetical protein n=1 Tax=Streptomyces sp. NBC_01237 TaxID=2903790 RepID=UPI002DDA84C0|nr:hypothetical protein [Streptomyces sp. NBC_01237]WRZ77209.1 hypothetical protein OG251_36720 [Streptomyces sp. NBC_01237]
MSVLRAPFTVSIPAGPPDPPPDWWPSSSHHQALKGLLQGLSDTAYAEQQQLTVSTVRDYRRSCRGGYSVGTDRALAHLAVRDGLITVVRLPEGGADDLPTEVLEVWRHLAFDVPDRTLAAAIARETGLSRDQVESALSVLRSEGESDCALIARGYACGALTGREMTEPSFHTRTVRTESPSRRPRSGAPPVRRPRGIDPLRLVPDGVPWPPDGMGVLSGDVVTGLDVDVVRATPDACRTALRTLIHAHGQSWGPVLGDVEGGTALFLVQPGVLPDGWRSSGGRLWRRGAILRRIPAPWVRGGSGLYWAVEGQGKYWRPDVLADALAPPTAAAGGR